MFKILFFAAIVTLTQVVPAMTVKKDAEATVSAYHNRVQLAIAAADAR